MNVFFTSDHHFYHQNIIRLAERPFNNIEKMHEALITNWRKVVHDNDTVFVLGDFSWRFDHIPKLLDSLPGTKHLIAGNHDKCFRELAGISTYKKYTDFYLASGFTSVYLNDRIRINNQWVNLSHFPYRNEQTEQRYADQRLTDNGDWLIHGHIHNKGLVKDRMINVSVEMWDYSPVCIERIRQIILSDTGSQEEGDARDG